MRQAGYLMLVLLAVNAGCSGKSQDQWTEARPQTFPVQGVVTYKGEPLSEATVIFQSTGAEPVTAAGRTNSQGEFLLGTFEDADGAVAGDHKVIITAVKIEGPPPGANLDEVDPTTRETSLIPTKYNDFNRSGLSATVTQEQENAFRFELTD